MADDQIASACRSLYNRKLCGEGKMPADAPELTVARKTAAIRLPDDLVNMANVVASLQKRPAVDVLDELVRPPLTRLYKAELAKASKRAAGKEED